MSPINPASIPEIGVGMLGYAFMGKAHSNAFKKIPYMFDPPPAMPRLIAICGRDAQAAAAAARRYGYATSYTDWRQLLDDEQVQVFDNGAPNALHAEPCLAAAAAGKHIICEKPLARTADEALVMLEAAQAAGVKHMTAFNYRFAPAIRLARQLLEAGRLGRLYHFRAVYLQEGLVSPTAPWRWRHDQATAGSGALGDLGAHIIDLAHFLAGEIGSVSALTRTFTPQRPLPDGRMRSVDVDDAFAAVVEFANGALGTLEATRVAAGRKNYNCLEINGEHGSLRFNLERLNELEVYWVDDTPHETRGWRTILVTEPEHPWGEVWWPRGHILGWEHTFVHELHHFLACIVHDKPVAPLGADFVDGYRAAVVCDAILQSAAQRRPATVHYAV